MLIEVVLSYLLQRRFSIRSWLIALRHTGASVMWSALAFNRLVDGKYTLKRQNYNSRVFVAASHQTRLDTRSKARRPIKVGIKGRGRSGTSRDSNPAGLCCWSAHLVQCEPDEASSFTNPNVGPGTYASLRLKLDAWSSAVQRGQKCRTTTRRLPSRSWGPIRPQVCSWFRAPIRHECQTAQPNGRGRAHREVEMFS